MKKILFFASMTLMLLSAVGLSACSSSDDGLEIPIPSNDNTGNNTGSNNDNNNDNSDNNNNESNENGNQADSTTTGRTLIAYFSFTNNSAEIANTLADQIDADVERIETVAENQNYAANNYRLGSDMVARINANPDDAASYPALKNSNRDISNYDNVILVTPLWSSHMAAPSQSYLFQNRAELAGKHFTMIVSSYSSGISLVVRDARRLVPEATWLGDALWINNRNQSNRATLISDWLDGMNFPRKN